MINKKNLMPLLPSIMAIIVDGMGFGLVYPIMTAIFTEGHALLSADLSPTLRHFYLGLSYMLYPFCMFFGASFMGDLSDRFGRKKILLLCMIGIFLSFTLMALGVVFTSIFLLLLGRALSGLSAGSQPIAQAAISDLSTVENKAVNMSIMTFALSIAIVLGPLVGGFFSDSKISYYFTFATPFWIAAAIAFVTSLWIILGMRETFVPTVKKTISVFRPITLFIDGFKIKSVKTLAIIFLLMQFGFSIYFQFILVLLKSEFNYSNWKLGLFNGFIGFAFALSTLAGVKLFLQYFKENRIASLSLFLVGLFLVLTSFFYNQAIIWLFAFPIGFFDMIAYTLILTAFSNAVDENSQGWVMGISAAIMAVSWSLSGLCANLLPFLGTRGLIFGGGLLLLLSAIFMNFYKDHHQI